MLVAVTIPNVGPLRPLICYESCASTNLLLHSVHVVGGGDGRKSIAVENITLRGLDGRDDGKACAASCCGLCRALHSPIFVVNLSGGSASN